MFVKFIESVNFVYLFQFCICYIKCVFSQVSLIVDPRGHKIMDYIFVYIFYRRFNMAQMKDLDLVFNVLSIWYYCIILVYILCERSYIIFMGKTITYQP